MSVTALGGAEMPLVGPERYQLTAEDSRTFTVRCSAGTPKFSGIGASKLSKLYIFSIDRSPVYVGITRQPMRSRIRMGFSADGESGYYGYLWRHHVKQVDLDIWACPSPSTEQIVKDMETIEAEVVHVIRCAGNWPKFQTEIHFHQSTEAHRAVAMRVLSSFVLKA